jgi:hypothetical protein
MDGRFWAGWQRVVHQDGVYLTWTVMGWRYLYLFSSICSHLGSRSCFVFCLFFFLYPPTFVKLYFLAGYSALSIGWGHIRKDYPSSEEKRETYFSMNSSLMMCLTSPLRLISHNQGVYLYDNNICQSPTTFHLCIYLPAELRFQTYELSTQKHPLFIHHSPVQPHHLPRHMLGWDSYQLLNHMLISWPGVHMPMSDLILTCKIIEGILQDSFNLPSAHHISANNLFHLSSSFTRVLPSYLGVRCPRPSLTSSHTAHLNRTLAVTRES